MKRVPSLSVRSTLASTSSRAWATISCNSIRLSSSALYPSMVCSAGLVSRMRLVSPSTRYRPSADCSTTAR
jgi:hypothetical protein